MLQYPAVLHLGVALVIAKDTQNGDGVANDGLYVHFAVLLGAVSIEGAVDVQRVTFGILNIQVAICSLLNLGDNAGNLVLVLGVHTDRNLFAGGQSLLDGDFSTVGSGQSQFCVAGHFGSFEGENPAVLDLGSAVVVTYRTHNGDNVTGNRLGGHVLIGSRAVRAIGTVDGQDVALRIGDFHVAVCSIINLSDCTGNLILLFGVNVMLSGKGQINSFLYSQLFDGILNCVFPFVQGTALSKLHFALVVGDLAGDGNGIANAKVYIFHAGACQTIDLNGLIGHAGNHDGNGDVAEGGAIGSVDLGDLTGQSCLVGQGLVFLQLVSFLHDLLGIGGSLHFGAGLFNLQQRTAFAELDAALIVYDVTLHGDGVTDQEGICAFALNAVAQQLFAFVAFNRDGYGNVLVAGIVGGVDLGDLTGQGSLILGRTAVCQLKGFLHDGFHISRSFYFAGGSYTQKLAASIELDLALIVGQGTGNGDGVAGLQVFSAFALQTVALNGLALNANNIHGNSDVLVAFVVGGVHLVDHTGQGDFTVHGSALLQSIGFVHDSAEVQVHLGNDVLPAEGNDLVAILDSGGQGVGNFFCGGFVYIDGHAAVSVLDHLDVLFSDVNRPYNFVGLAVHRNSANTGKVPRGLLCGLSVEGLDIFQRGLKISRRTGRTAGFLLHAGGQAGAKAQAECQNQHKCE